MTDKTIVRCASIGVGSAKYLCTQRSAACTLNYNNSSTLSPEIISNPRIKTKIYQNNYNKRPNPGNGWRQYKTYLQCPQGKKWYYRYKSNNQHLNVEEMTTKEHVATDNKNKFTYSLCYFHNEDERKGKLIVQYTPVADMRIFTMFSSFLDFSRYASSVETNLCCFYESISGDMAQKPHFDLDIKHQDLVDLGIDDHNIIISHLVDAIFVVIARYDIYLEVNRDLLIYSSHGEEKISYHVIINHYYHCNNKESGYFANLVIAEMPEELQSFVDKSVYSSFQQFRILGSEKVGSGRPKKFNETYLLPAIDEDGNDIIIEHEYDGIAPDVYVLKNMQLAESLITQVNGCYLLPSFIPFEEKERSIYTDVDDLKKEDALTALNYLAMVAGITICDTRFPYRIRGIQGNRIDLQRVRSSYCRQCGRAHENEHPYMVVSKTNKLYFYCRRKKDIRGADVGYIVGTIPGELLVKLDQKDTELSINAKATITSMLQRYNMSTADTTTSTIAEKNLHSTSVNSSDINNKTEVFVKKTPAGHTLIQNFGETCTSPLRQTQINYQKLRLLASQPIPGKRPLKDSRKTNKKKKEQIFSNVFANIDW